MQPQEPLTVVLEPSPLECWNEESTASALRALAVWLHSTGISLRRGRWTRLRGVYYGVEFAVHAGLSRTDILAYGANRLEQLIWNVPTWFQRAINRIGTSSRSLDRDIRELLRSFDKAGDQTDEALVSFRSGFDELGVALQLFWRGLGKFKRRLREAYQAIRDGSRTE